MQDPTRAEFQVLNAQVFNCLTLAAQRVASVANSTNSSVSAIDQVCKLTNYHLPYRIIHSYCIVHASTVSYTLQLNHTHLYRIIHTSIVSYTTQLHPCAPTMRPPPPPQPPPPQCCVATWCEVGIDALRATSVMHSDKLVLPALRKHHSMACCQLDIANSAEHSVPCCLMVFRSRKV